MATDSADKTRTRSPAYPYIDLEEAVSRAAQVNESVRRGTASSEFLAALWGYGEKSSGGRMTVAALKKFGLLEEIGRDGPRQLRLTKLALTILLSDGPGHREERLRALQDAALAPAIHRDLYERWGPNHPPDSAIKLYLVRDREFNEAAVNDFIKQYKRTIAFARLDGIDALEKSDGNGMIGVEPDDDPEDPPAPRSPAPGSLAPVNPMIVNPAPHVASPAAFPPIATAAAVRILSVPLDDGKTFDIRFPVDLSKEDFDFVVENIKLWERKIVAKPKTSGEVSAALPAPAPEQSAQAALPSPQSDGAPE
jgi:hypothetical protein